MAPTSNKRWRTLSSFLVSLSLAYGIWLILSKSLEPLHQFCPPTLLSPPAYCLPTRTILPPYLPTPLDSYPFIILPSYHPTPPTFRHWHVSYNWTGRNSTKFMGRKTNWTTNIQKTRRRMAHVRKEVLCERFVVRHTCSTGKYFRASFVVGSVIY